MSLMEKTTVLSQYTYEVCKNRFSTETAAQIYSTRHTLSKKGRREKACIQAALLGLPKNSLILDLPCGTGRISYFLHELGYRVIAADYSSHMVEQAGKELKDENIRFEQQDIMSIQHADNSFQAAICNRLFHHYPAAETRRLALKELMRVTDGPIIISFFNSLSLSACFSKLKNILRNRQPIDRVPISFYSFKKDIEACGLRIEGSYFCRFGISPQTYLRLVGSRGEVC